jgi:hypothetical protein
MIGVEELSHRFDSIQLAILSTSEDAGAAFASASSAGGACGAKG